jgi:hypothetical protein
MKRMGRALLQLFMIAFIFCAGWLYGAITYDCGEIHESMMLFKDNKALQRDIWVMEPESDVFDSFSSGYPTGEYATQEDYPMYEDTLSDTPPPDIEVEEKEPIKAAIPVILDPKERKKGAAASRDIFRSFLEDREQQLGTRSSAFKKRFDCGDIECPTNVPEQVQDDYDRMQIQQRAVGDMEEGFVGGKSYKFSDE